MKIHQAFFGNKNGSHNLLFSTLEDSAIIGKLKYQTDKPESIDMEFAYLSGYQVNDFYVFSKTMKDATARRGGMVFTHCFLIPIQNISQLTNVESLFTLFSSVVLHDFSEIMAFEWVENPTISTPKAAIYDTFIHYLISNKKTVVYIGNDYFQDCITHLWVNLPTSLKKKFSFTISGTPNEIQGENYTLIYTPLSHVNKWAGFPCIKKIEPNINQSQAHLFLSETNPEKRMTFNQFIEDNEIELGQIVQLSDINACIEQINQVKVEPTFSNLRSLLPFIIKLLPDPSKGKGLKDGILQQFITVLKIATIDSVKSVRNLRFEAFENGQVVVEKAVREWANATIHSNSTVSVQSVSDLLVTVFEEQGPDWWNQIIFNHTKNWCENISYTKDAEYVWSIWQQDKSRMTHLGQFVLGDKEKLFLDSFPLKVDKDFYQAVSIFALKKQWFSIYALANLNTCPLKEAIELQIKNDVSHFFKENLSIIAQNADKKGFVVASVEINNPVLYPIAGKVCSQEIGLLQNIVIENEAWQGIWYASFLFTKDITKGVKGIQLLFHKLLDLYLEGQDVKIELLVAIEKVIENLYNYPNRKEIWVKLPQSIKDSLLNKTSLFVFEHYNEIAFTELENVIMNHLKEKLFIDTFVIRNQASLMFKMQFLEKISKLNQEYGVEVLKNTTKLEELEASFLAEIIKKKDWKDVLNYIYDNDSRNYYKSILQECKEMLSKWQRIWLMGGKKLNSIKDLEDMIDSHNFYEAFNLLDKIEHQDKGFYKKLKEEYMGGSSKGIDKKDLAERLKVYINSYLSA